MKQKKQSSFKDKLNSPLSTLWSENKMFFVVFIVIILIYKFQDVIIDVLVENSKSILNKTRNESASLKEASDLLNSKSNQLINESNELLNKKSKIDEDWHKQ